MGFGRGGAFLICAKVTLVRVLAYVDRYASMYQDTYQDNTVATKQERYERTPKGRQARQMAITAYRVRRVKWEVWLDEEMSEALEASIPDGVSKTDYLKKIFQEHLDKALTK